jgi:TolB-like protein/DNA-binding winged helix-turn-helix (wHTH) protein/Tfp pilus assembly protein PilF
MKVAPSSHLVRFGVFEVDLRAGELRKQGVKLRLPEQSFQILAMLLEHPGELVTREEIQDRLWPNDTIVEFENSINAAVRRLRLALGDSADEPRFVETLARRGYRLIVEVERPPEAGNRAEPSPSPSPEVVASAPLVSLAKGHKKALLAGFAVLAVLALGLYLSRIDRMGFDRAARSQERGPAEAAREAIDSIAVLPFQNIGGDRETEYLSDGITEGIISALSRLPRLRVMARSMVFHYKGSDVDPRKIGGDLKVRAVITGRVALRGNTLMISTEMMEVKDGSQLWGEQYSRKLADAIAIQEEMARDISERLRLRITGEEKRLLTRRYTENVEAYELYLKGRYFLNRYKATDLQRSIEYFQQAIARDPRYALPYAGLADSFRVLAYVHRMAIKENFEKSKAAATKALEIDETVSEAHFSLAMVLEFWDWDWAGAERHLKRALELNPNSADLHNEYGLYLARIGRGEEARRELDRALEIEPFVQRAGGFSGYGFYLTRNLGKAEEVSRIKLESDPNNTAARFILGQVHELKGMYPEAIAEHEKAWLSGGNPDQLGHLGHAYAKAGNRAKAYEIIERLKRAEQGYLHVYEIAFIYAGLGEKERAFEWLDKAYQQRDRGLLFLKTDHCLDPLRSDPRFQDLLRRLNLPEEQPSR